MNILGDDWNIIMWMDHRAKKEAAIINQTKHQMLDNVGGKISLEMQVPKLLWLKKNNPTCWKKAKNMFDLPDFLTWKATNSLSRFVSFSPHSLILFSVISFLTKKIMMYIMQSLM